MKEPSLCLLLFSLTVLSQCLLPLSPGQAGRLLLPPAGCFTVILVVSRIWLNGLSDLVHLFWILHVTVPLLPFWFLWAVAGRLDAVLTARMTRAAVTGRHASGRIWRAGWRGRGRRDAAWRRNLATAMAGARKTPLSDTRSALRDVMSVRACWKRMTKAVTKRVRK
jgi:hypothetical protein